MDSIPLVKALVWLSSSQLGSTLIALAIGSVAIYKWQTKHQFQYDVIRCVVKDVSIYADCAVRYWSSFLLSSGNIDRTELLMKVKSGLPSLYELIDSIDVFDAKRKLQVHDSLGRLFDVATGGAFEASEEAQRETAPVQIELILSALATAKSRLYLAAFK